MEEEIFMTPELVRQLLDSCFIGKHITEMMPPLPQGMKPRHIHILQAVGQGEKEGRTVLPSDISREWKVTRPSVVRLIRELEEMGAVSAVPGGTDRRTRELHLTEKGNRCYKRYVEQYHQMLADQLCGMNEEDCRRAVSVWQILYSRMKGLDHHE
jgi:DNA-binding MarR family transcriptional regulator